MSALPEREGARLLAGHLQGAGHSVLAHGVATAHGLLAVAARLPGGWMFGDLRISADGQPFAPPIGAYSETARSTLRRQATDWFNANGRLPQPHDVIRLDAFGLVLRNGAPHEWQHVADAY